MVSIFDFNFDLLLVVRINLKWLYLRINNEGGSYFRVSKCMRSILFCCNKQLDAHLERELLFFYYMHYIDISSGGNWKCFFF